LCVFHPRERKRNICFFFEESDDNEFGSYNKLKLVDIDHNKKKSQQLVFFVVVGGF